MRKVAIGDEARPTSARARKQAGRASAVAAMAAAMLHRGFGDCSGPRPRAGRPMRRSLRVHEPPGMVGQR